MSVIQEDYIIALTHLYGLVHKDKVLEIYNQQNRRNVETLRFRKYILEDEFVVTYGDYFVHETILEYDDFEYQLKAREGKPFYVPEKEELLKYRDEYYIEITPQYIKLLEFLTHDLFNGDTKKATIIGEDIQGTCQYGFSIGSSIETIFDSINRRGVQFKDREQANEFLLLIQELHNNTRLWENNGHTPQVLFDLLDRQHLFPLPKGFPGHHNSDKSTPASKKGKIGRNDPCHCGSGKKYKYCCLDKDERGKTIH
jgi:hypothetical protein